MEQKDKILTTFIIITFLVSIGYTYKQTMIDNNFEVLEITDE